MSSNLRKRLAVAGLGVPLCALATYAGGYVFVAGLGAAAALGYREFARMMRGTGTRVLALPGIVAASLFPLIVFGGGLGGGGWYAAGLMLALPALALATVELARRPIRAAALTTFGVFYVGGLLALGVPLRESALLFFPGGTVAGARMAGTLLFLFPVAITWLSDTAAYLGGRAFGKRPLAPRLSPNKTVAGGVCALLAGLGTGFLYPRLLMPEIWTLDLVPTLAFGLVVSGFAIVGDLAESALKRECGVKDSSDLLPGHGGMLDRLDSVLWAIPAAFLFLLLVA